MTKEAISARIKKGKMQGPTRRTTRAQNGCSHDSFGVRSIKRCIVRHLAVACLVTHGVLSVPDGVSCGSPHLSHRLFGKYRSSADSLPVPGWTFSHPDYSPMKAPGEFGAADSAHRRPYAWKLSRYPCIGRGPAGSRTKMTKMSFF